MCWAFRLRVSGIQLPMVDSSSESDSDAHSDAASTLTDTVSEEGSIVDAASDIGSIAGHDRPSALRSHMPLLPIDEARTTLAADTASAERPRCDAFIHPSHQSESGIHQLIAALLDLDQELVRAGAPPSTASYPRAVPRHPVDEMWRLMRRVEQLTAALGQGED